MDRMKVVFHEDFYKVYALDPAAGAGRLEGIVDLIQNDSFYEIVEAIPAKKVDILRAHTDRHFLRVKDESLVFHTAMLAAGGAIQTADIAYTEKTASFGLIRPPGHHASRDSSWGFCYFNNIAVSLLFLVQKYRLRSIFLLDFDLHTGDGNINILETEEGVKVEILNPYSNNEEKYMQEIKNTLDSLSNIDVIIASAGFDNAQGDWGEVLSTESYNQIGKWMKEYSIKLCNGRRYALLEGGYNYSLLPRNFDRFCKGFG
ncbi:MAG: histone deacetylase family protein [Promethearchaeota archaeon]|nr:MAG: histone deacetylase family protein [Candidatus Lokiarchaeota archaeon]